MEVMGIVLSPKKITLFFWFILACLFLLHLAGQFSTYFLGHNSVYDLIPLFNINIEKNIPSLYTFIVWLFCSLLLALISIVKHKQRAEYVRYWAMLSLIFLYLAFDEFFSIHEMLEEALHAEYDLKGYLRFAWVIPYGIAFIIFSSLYLRFVLSLPPFTKNLFFLSAIVFISGAIGVEMIGANYYDQFGNKNITYSLIVTVEEFLELSGLILFIYTLTSYIDRSLNGLVLTITLCDKGREK